MTAYEVSISKLAAFDDAAEFNIDEEFELYSHIPDSSREGHTQEG